MVIVTASLLIKTIPVWIGAIVAGLALMAIAQEPLGRARLLWTATEHSTSSVGDGIVSVSGTAIAETNRRLTSKLAGADCLAYEHTKTKTRHDSGAGKIKSTRTNQEVLPFSVDDGSGPVLVDATTGTLSLTTDYEDTSGSTHYEEGILQAGDEVTVYGESQQPHGTHNLPADTDRVITTGSEYGDVVVTDESGSRILIRQLAYFIAWVGVGGALVAAGIGMMLELV